VRIRRAEHHERLGVLPRHHDVSGPSGPETSSRPTVVVVVIRLFAPTPASRRLRLPSYWEVKASCFPSPESAERSVAGPLVRRRAMPPSFATQYKGWPRVAEDDLRAICRGKPKEARRVREILSRSESVDREHEQEDDYKAE
jgi:hypothetical protein